MSSERFSIEQIADYQRHGLYIHKRLFDAEEMDLLARSAKADRELDQHSFQRDDGAIKRVGVKRFADADADVAWLADREDHTALGLARKQRL